MNKNGEQDQHDPSHEAKDASASDVHLHHEPPKHFFLNTYKI